MRGLSVRITRFLLPFWVAPALGLTVPQCSASPEKSSFRTSGPSWTVAIYPFTASAVDRPTAERLRKELLNRLDQDSHFEVVSSEQFQTLLPHVKDGNDFRREDRVKLAREADADVILVGRVEPIASLDPEIVRANLRHGTANQTHQVRFGVYSARTGKEWFVEQRFLFVPGPGESLTVDSIRTSLASFWGSAGRSVACPAANRFTEKWDREIGSRRNKGGWEPSQDQAGTITGVPAGKPPHYLYKPADFDKTGWSYPLIIFLHGTSQRSDALSPALFGVSPLAAAVNTTGTVSLDEKRLKLVDSRVRGSFVLLPQLRASGDPAWTSDDINDLVVEIVRNYPIHTKRIYLTGISRGGAGAWVYGADVHKKLAAVAPLAGSMSLFNPGPCFEGTAIWAFHAFDDTNLSVSHTSNQIENFLPGFLYYGDVNLFEGYPNRNHDPGLPADDDYTLNIEDQKHAGWRPGVRKPSGEIGFTVYRSGNHAIFNRTYSQDEFWSWMFSRERD